ncbi:hypothetical protein AB3N02_29840 [Priestia aryabhattai]|uniref:hypothetical protein n=1 Tax=Priestia aryabhattai TaxID=412384 RepID=UPI00399FB7CB
MTFKIALFHNKSNDFILMYVISLAIAVITAETKKEETDLAGPLELTWTRMATDLRDLSFPTIEKSRSIFIHHRKRARDNIIKTGLLLEVQPMLLKS